MPLKPLPPQIMQGILAGRDVRNQLATCAVYKQSPTERPYAGGASTFARGKFTQMLACSY